jgi:VanZ family protein
MATYIPGYREDIIFTILFYTLGLVSLALVSTCISYLNRYADTKGFLLVVISICLVLSDLTFYNAYYLDFKVFYYADRIVNIIGVALLVVFVKKWIQKKEVESVTEI